MFFDFCQTHVSEKRKADFLLFFIVKSMQKAQGTSSADFSKRPFFYARKKSSKKFTCRFFAVFWGLKTFFALVNWLFKNVSSASLMCSFEWIRRFLPLFIQKNKMSGCGKRAIVRLRTFLNKQISGWNFDQRLSALSYNISWKFQLVWTFLGENRFLSGGGGESLNWHLNLVGIFFFLELKMIEENFLLVRENGFKKDEFENFPSSFLSISLFLN